MLDVIVDSIFNHMFSEDLKAEPSFLILAPQKSRVNYVHGVILDKLKEWKLEFIARQDRIVVEDITIDFRFIDPNNSRGKVYDYVFLIDSETYSDEMNTLIDYTFRPFMVVIG